MLIEEPWRAEEARQAKADMGAIRCDCCNGLIRKGDAVYSLYLGYERLSLCKGMRQPVCQFRRSLRI